MVVNTERNCYLFSLLNDSNHSCYRIVIELRKKLAINTLRNYQLAFSELTKGFNFPVLQLIFSIITE